MTYFLLREYNILPKKELHGSPWVCSRGVLRPLSKDRKGFLAGLGQTFPKLGREEPDHREALGQGHHSSFEKAGTEVIGAEVVEGPG